MKPSAPVSKGSTPSPSSGQNVPPPMEKDAPAPRKVVKKIPIKGLKTKGFSVKSALQPEKTADESIKEENQVIGNRPEKEFTEADLHGVWNAYSEQQREQGNISFYETLKGRKPKRSGKVITFEIDNKVQQNYFQENKSDLMDFLRARLQNYSLSFSVVLSKGSETQTAYSPTEKFQKLAEKNPELIKLKQRFNLDLDF